LGASEVNLLELANAYRSMASGILAQPYVIRKIVLQPGGVVADEKTVPSPTAIGDGALALIQEGLRGVVRIPGGTAHALDSRGFPVAVMGKTGTTNEFRDALFVGSTYGPDGITVAVRIGFDDNRSLGPRETGGRVALPVFKEIMLRVYAEKLAGPVPQFPPRMEQSINVYVKGDLVETAAAPDSSRGDVQIAGCFLSDLPQREVVRGAAAADVGVEPRERVRARGGKRVAEIIGTVITILSPGSSSPPRAHKRGWVIDQF
jgi:membrane carboxypeptidase/penicillin-binding protein